ncbi:MAG: rod shape-determining protein, partial [Clostridia bacterium]|nr:rod shape-determining protein [Clostridia bacterium]
MRLLRDRASTFSIQSINSGSESKPVRILSSQVRDAMSDAIYQIVDTIRDTLEQTPPELASDIMNYGITITGGGALIRNLDNLISQMTGIPVRVSDEPLNCVAVGTGLAAENDVI